MSQLRVTPQQLKEASDKLVEMSGTYTRIYKQLLQEASAMGTAWEGTDNAAFVTKINGCCDDLSKMATKLDYAGQALKKQSINYSGRQEENVTLVQKL